MSLWIWVTILAAVSQSLRTAQAKNLKPVLGNFGASYIRFSYAVPFSWILILFYWYYSGQSLPSLNFKFLKNSSTWSGRVKTSFPG